MLPPGWVIVRRIRYEPTGVAGSGVHVSSCGPGRSRAFVRQATLVACRAVRTASSFTLAVRLRVKPTTAVSRPGHAGRDRREEPTIAGIAATDVPRRHRQGGTGASPACEDGARCDGEREQGASRGEQEARSSDAVGHGHTVDDEHDRTVSTRPARGPPRALGPVSPASVKA